MKEGTSRTRSKYKYNVKTYDQISIRVPKGARDRYKKCAEERGISLACLIVKSVEEYVAKHPTDYDRVSDRKDTTEK